MKTRKLKDLKESEVIKVVNNKEFDYIFKRLCEIHLSKQYPNPGLSIYPLFLSVSEGGVFWQAEEPKGKTILSYSDFIKPKNNKKWKEAFQEIARLNGEVQELKEKLKFLNLLDKHIPKETPIVIVKFPEHANND